MKLDWTELDILITLLLDEPALVDEHISNFGVYEPAKLRIKIVNKLQKLAEKELAL